MLRRERLSARQHQILDGLAAGRSNSIIAGELGITLDGVKWHVSELLGETGCTNRQELAEWWQREAPRRPVPAFLPLRILSHEAVVGAARIVLVFAISVAIAAAIAAAASRESRTGVVVTSAAPEKLAYVRDGDIWVKALPDGVAQQVTHHTDDQDTYLRPRWSPSGEWLAFLAGTQPGVMRAGGTGLRRIRDFSGWSPVEDRYVGIDSGADSDGYITIFTENADGSDHRVVTKTFPSNGHLTNQIRGPRWSPDGLWIAYTVLQEGIPELPPYRAVNMWVVSAGGGTPLNVYDAGSPSQDDIVLVGWSPDGHTLFFALDPSFSASAPADGLALQAIRVLPDVAPKPIDLVPAPATVLLADEWWAKRPGRSTIAVTDGAGRETWTNKRIAIVSWVNGTVTDLTDAELAAIQPAWSPDGEHIAYAAAPDAGLGVAGGDAAKAAMAQRKIWTMNVAGSDQRQLTDDPAYRDEFPRWSADGSRIYFMRLDAEDRWSLWMIPSAGGTPAEVLDDVSPPDAAGSPAWFGYYGYIAWGSYVDWWPG